MSRPIHTSQADLEPLFLVDVSAPKSDQIELERKFGSRANFLIASVPLWLFRCIDRSRVDMPSKCNARVCRRCFTLEITAHIRRQQPAILGTEVTAANQTSTEHELDDFCAMPRRPEDWTMLHSS